MVLRTIELEPNAVGTTIHFRYGAAETRREVAAMDVIAPANGEALQANIRSLTAQLDADACSSEGLHFCMGGPLAAEADATP